MTLKYIALYIGPESGYEDNFRNGFNLHSRFISNYLSVEIRKCKFKTDGTFNMISVRPALKISEICKIVGDDALRASVSFNKDDYDKMNEVQRYEYYMQLLEEGYQICNQFKKIPLEYLLKLHQELRSNGYKNEWLYKKKKFKEYNIEVKLKCFFTSFDFHLVITINDIVTSEQLISGTVIRSLPDEIHFQKDFKDVLIEDDYLIITDFLDRPRIRLRLSDVYNKQFLFELLGKGIEYIAYTG